MFGNAKLPVLSMREQVIAYIVPVLTVTGPMVNDKSAPPVPLAMTVLLVAITDPTTFKVFKVEICAT